MEKNQNKYTQEFTFKDVFLIIKRYKWSILFISILSTVLGTSYIYFKPNIYSSYAIIKVKPHIKSKSEDLINNTITTKSKDITEDITLLKTFKINKQVLKKINFHVQYFINKKFKRIEIHDNVPINIKNINILNGQIIGKRLTLIPKENGFILRYITSYTKQIQHKIFNTKPFSLETETIFPYGKKITTKFFTLRVNKISDFITPIHFVINGEAREIFENIVKKNLKVTQLEKDTSLIKIAYQDTIPARSTLYVNTLIQNFIEHSINNKNRQNSKTLKFIVEELNDIKKELKKSEEKLENYQVSKSIVKPSVQGSLFIKNLSNIEIELSENNLKKKLILNLINFVQNNYNLDAIAPSLSKLGDKSTLQLITKLQDYQLEVDELSLEYTNEHPKLKSLRRQIENIRSKIEFNLKSLRTSIEYQNKSLIERKSSYENELKRLPSQERNLVNIKRNYEVNSRMYEYLLKKEAENKIIQFATLSDYQIVDYAYNSHRPIKNKKLLILLVSTLIGFVFAFLLSLLRNKFNRYIQNQEDLEKLTTLPIYGTIPFQKQKPYSLEVSTNSRSAFTESFRTLRTNLQFLKKPNDLATTILVTSTIAGEGKTTISANLATMFEKAKYKTLLINLDIRKPTLHHFFSINYQEGISTYLNSNNSDVKEIIFATEFANLDIISSGPIVEEPSELILSKRLPLLLEELKTMYEYIIIDTAPIGIVTDTKTIMQYSDLNLIILRENYAREEFVLTIDQMIQQHEFKNVGLLLNASKTEGGEYGYGYSYEYKQ